jgi:hypothetical protein
LGNPEPRRREWQSKGSAAFASEGGFEMDSSSGMKRRGGWTWKMWLGIALGLAVLVAVIVIAANAGSGSGGIY